MKFIRNYAVKFIGYFLISVLFSACSSINSPQKVNYLNTYNNITKNNSIEGKFRFKSGNQSSSGLFTWHSYGDAWLFELSTPINTNIANIIYGNLNSIELKQNIAQKQNIYTWDKLMLMQQSININPQTFNSILENLEIKSKIEDALSNSEWKLSHYQKNEDNLILEIYRDDNTSLKLFVLNK